MIRPPSLKNSVCLTATLLTLGGVMAAQADYQSTILGQGPVGYYRLSETTQPQPAITTANNLGTFGATGNGTYEGTQGFFRGYPGALASSDTAIHTDGSSQDVAVPYAAALNPATFTVEGWFNADVSSAQCAISCGHFGSPRSGWLIYQNGTDGYNLRMYNQNGTATSLNIASAGTPVIGNWVHLVATFDGTTARLYINGALAVSGNPTGYVPGTDGAFAIGMRSDTGFRWAGKIDEVAFYSTALSAGDIAAHYGAATTNAAGYAAMIQAGNPLLYFRLNEAGDPFAANLGSLGSSALGAYAVGSVPGRAGPRPIPYPGFDSGNNAVAFQATGGSVALQPLHLNANTVTITCWINATNSQALATGLVLCRSANTVAGLTISAAFGGYDLGYNWNNDPNAYNWNPSSLAGLPPLPDSDWAFAALVVSPNEAAIYICDRTNYANFTSATNILVHPPQQFEGLTLIGADGGFNNRFFYGAMDEVAIFNRSLAAGELYTQYGAAVGNVPVKIFADPQTPIDPLYAGDPLTLTVDAGGTPNVAYQWRKNTSPVAGATSSAFVIPVLATTDSGAYDCVVTNQYGQAMSGSATISVNAALPPTVTVPPVGHNLYPGGTLNVSVTAIGGGLRYQWQKNSSPIAGATNSAYIVASATTNDTGSYSVTITNTSGTASAGPVTVTVVAPANAYEKAIVTDAPEAWYRLNETSGTSMFDSMGRHDGVYTNVTGSPVTLGAAGAITGSSDKAVSFDGLSSSYGYVPFSPKLNGADFTIECWAKTATNTVDMVPVSSVSAVPQGYWLRTYPSGSWSGGVFSGGNGYYVPSATAADGITVGQWKHVVMSYSSSTALRMYINGQWDGVGYVNFDRNAVAPFIIGGLGGTSVGNLFGGQIDEVLVYTRAITLAQAQAHYSAAVFPSPIPPFFLSVPSSQEVLSNSAASVTFSGVADGPIPITYQWYKNGTVIAGATTTALTLSCANSNAASYVLRATNPNGATNSAAATLSILPPNPSYVNVTNGLVLHLKFDGNYADSSGRGNNGTAVGSPSIVPGRLGSALFFSTSNSISSVNYVTLNKPADLNFSSNVNFSVSYWVKYDAGQTNGDLPFLCSAVNSYGNAGLTFAPSYKEGGWSYSLNGAVQTYGGANTINDGNWHHLLHTFDRVGSALTYLDGVQVDSRPCAAAGNLDTGNTINVGQDPTGLYPEDGSTALDDLAVWRRALTAYEAYSVHYAASVGNSSFDIPGTVKLNANLVGGNLVLSWTPGPTLGTLLQADNLTGPWTSVGVYTPSYTVAPSAAKKFYRLQFSE